MVLGVDPIESARLVVSPATRRPFSKTLCSLGDLKTIVAAGDRTHGPALVHDHDNETLTAWRIAIVDASH